MHLGDIADYWREDAACKGRAKSRITQHAGRYQSGDPWSAYSPTPFFGHDSALGLTFSHAANFADATGPGARRTRPHIPPFAAAVADRASPPRTAAEASRSLAP